MNITDLINDMLYVIYDSTDIHDQDCLRATCSKFFSMFKSNGYFKLNILKKLVNKYIEQTKQIISYKGYRTTDPSDIEYPKYGVVADSVKDPLKYYYSEEYTANQGEKEIKVVINDDYFGIVTMVSNHLPKRKIKKHYRYQGYITFNDSKTHFQIRYDRLYFSCDMENNITIPGTVFDYYFEKPNSKSI